jgi:lysophospholipase L1-like esterase
MRIYKYFLSIAIIFTCLVSDTYSQDFQNLERFREENVKLMKEKSGEKNRVVFMGNSITESWLYLSPEFFKDKPYINRGISGQTSPQMLLRFRQDVINLKPELVVILAGTNDIAGNTGQATNEMIMDNIISMSELARSNGIEIILCSILPCYDFPWNLGLKPYLRIIEMNKLIKDYCTKNNIYFLDFYSQMCDDNNGLKKEFSEDGVHPNAIGYKVMNSLADKAIADVLYQ